MQTLFFRLGFRPCRELVALPALAHSLQGHAGWWGQGSSSNAWLRVTLGGCSWCPWRLLSCLQPNTQNLKVLWPCGRHAGEVMWLTFQTACNGSWKKERFWRNTDVWPPICPAACKYFWKELQSLVLCVMWSSSGKS